MMNRYRTGEDFRRLMEQRRMEQQLGAGGQGPIFESPLPGAPPDKVRPSNVPRRVLGIDELPPPPIREDFHGPGTHVPQFPLNPVDVDDVNTGHDFSQPYRGEQALDEVAYRVLQGGRELDYRLGLRGDNEPIANRQELPGVGSYDIVRDPTHRDFSHYPFGDAPAPGYETPIVNDAGEVERWETKKPPAARETIPRPVLPQDGMFEDQPDVGDVGAAAGIQDAIARAGRGVEDQGEYEPTPEEVEQVSAAMPTGESRSWLQRMMPALKVAGLAATGIGMAKSPEFRRGVLKGFGSELQQRRQFDRQRQLAASKLRPHKPMELKDNKLIYYDSVGNILRMQDLGPDGPKIQDRIDQFSGTTQYKKMGEKLTIFGKLRSAVEADMPIGDVATIFAFIQGLDDTAVREGERDLLLGAAPLKEKVLNFLTGRGWKEGRNLRPSQLKGILEISRQWMDEEVKTFRRFRDGRVESLGRTISGQDWNELLDDPTRDWKIQDRREAQQQTRTGAVQPGDVRTNPETGVSKRYLGNQKWETVKPSDAGGQSGNVPQRNNNMGNLKRGGVGDQYAMQDAEGNPMTDGEDHLIFPDAEAGRMALERDLEAKIGGNSSASRRILGRNPRNVGELSQVYLAGESEEAKAAWRNGVRSILAQHHGVETDILTNIPVEILAQAIARQEGFFAGRG